MFRMCARCIMKDVFHSSLLSSSISICEQKLNYWTAKTQYTTVNHPIHNHLWFTMMYIRSRWIPILFVMKTTLVHQLPTLYAVYAFTLYWAGVFSYLQCFWIVQECFEPGIPFITCSNNIRQPFSALLRNCYAYCCFHKGGFTSERKHECGMQKRCVCSCG